MTATTSASSSGEWGSFDDVAGGGRITPTCTEHIPGAIHSNSDSNENGFSHWLLLSDDQKPRWRA